MKKSTIKTCTSYCLYEINIYRICNCLYDAIFLFRSYLVERRADYVAYDPKEAVPCWPIEDVQRTYQEQGETLTLTASLQILIFFFFPFLFLNDLNYKYRSQIYQKQDPRNEVNLTREETGGE